MHRCISLPPEARQMSTYNFHLSSGSGANIKGQGAWVEPFIWLRPVHVCVGEHLVVWCWLILESTTNTLYALFSTFLTYLQIFVQRPLYLSMYKYKLWLVSSLCCAFKIKKYFNFLYAKLSVCSLTLSVFLYLMIWCWSPIQTSVLNVGSWLIKCCSLPGFSVPER